MKRILALCAVCLILLTGVSGLAEEYRIDPKSAKPFAALLKDLYAAIQSPEDAGRLDGDVEAVRAASESDGRVARRIADHWLRTFLAPDEPLYLYDGGERAAALEAAGYRDGDIQAIVVLGYVLEDGAMTDELKGRCDAAAAVARSFPGAILVCSGGATGQNNPEGHTEASLMRDYLADRCGIESGRILTDERAMTTAENALNTFRMLEDNGIESITLVTSAYHQRWGQAVYNAVGALYAEASGYAPRIVANYCLDIEPSDERFRDGARIAMFQIGEILKLPRKK